MAHQLTQSSYRLARFMLAEETRSSVLLLAAAITALLFANTGLAASYFHFFDLTVRVGLLNLDIRGWINEGLMAVFFLVVGLEVKREFIDGELNHWRKAAFPVIAALGGMFVPALIFSLINTNQLQARGWAIPMATDIAIAIGVLELLGRNLPRSLRVFLLTLAVVDDIGSVAVVAIFYSHPRNVLMLLVGVALALVLLVMRQHRMRGLLFLLLGPALWYCLAVAGIAGASAGIAIALLLPLKHSRAGTKRLPFAERTETWLLPLSSYGVVPLFVFANAGIRFSDLLPRGLAAWQVFLGVFLGLTLGKPLGILLAGRLAVLLRLAHKPPAVTWRQILGAGMLAGIGFTVALLVANLSFSEQQPLHDAAILGIFAAAIISAGLGLLALGWRAHKT